SQASLPGCAPSPTTYCAAINPQHSVRIDTPPLSPEPKRSSSGNSVESVEQPWDAPDHASVLYLSSLDKRSTRSSGNSSRLMLSMMTVSVRDTPYLSCRSVRNL